MNYLSIENISKHYADQVLFHEISFGINKGEKVALVAQNGTGKTSLLRIIAGEDVPDEGLVRLHPDIVVGYLPQEPQLDQSLQVMDFIFKADAPAVQAIKEYESAVETAESDPDRLQRAMQQMELHQAWDLEAKVKKILHLLQIPVGAKMGTLSGGQQKRVALAEVLLREPHLLILDEPTNHLDVEMIEWLEDHLQQPGLSLLMVTHDRYFLDRVTNQVIELEGGNLYKYTGNYNYYIEKKAERQYNQQVEVEKAKQLMKKELEWVRRMPKARTTKSKSRLDAFEDIKDKASQKVKKEEVTLQVKTTRLGSKILEVKNASKSFGDKQILDNFTYSFKRGEKAGIVGKNGTGKTTFLNIITGKIPVDSGTIKTGETVEFGYYSQEGIRISEDKRVIEVVSEIADFIPMEKGVTLSAAQLLERFLFDRKKQYTFVSRLSGGEKRRLYLLTVLMKNPNFLILDEPTNDLDLPTLQVLEDFLDHFPGCLLVVTHDRFFMDRIVDHLFVFKGEGEVVDFPGNYSQYRDEREEAEQQKAQSRKQEKTESKQANKPKEKTKLSFNEKYEYEQLEKEIPQLEARKEELTNLMNSGETDHEKLLSWSQELETLIEQLDQKTERWFELAAYVDS